jgi:hypothetical protein
MKRTQASVPLLGAALTLVACEGGISGGSAPAGAGPGLGTAGVTAAAGAGAGGASVTAADCAAPTAGPAPLRRLSREQYDNSVRDLLAPQQSVTAAFELDERIGGYESNAVIPISPTSVARYRDAAEALAAEAVGRLDGLLPCTVATIGEDACARQFVTSFGRRVYRRPLASAEVDALMKLYGERKAKSDFAGAVGLVISALLQSPHFLYRVEQAPGKVAGSVVALSGLEVATRLAQFFWQAGPDDALLDAATAGELDTVEGVARHAERLLADDRSRAGVRSFFRQWLGLDALLTLDKNTQRFPDFTDQVRNSMFEESLRFAEASFRGEDRSLASLFGGTVSYLDVPLATFYGANAPGQAFARSDVSAQHRGGLLTLGAFLTVTSHPSEASPILRGKLVRNNILCEPLQPPPPSVNTTPPPRDPGVSTKVWLDSHRSNPSCSGCHQLMDPIGFIFQHYDAVGRYTEQDGNLPVDATGEVVTSGDAAGMYDGVGELAAGLAKSSQVRDCMAEQFVRYAVGRPKVAEDTCSIRAAGDALASAQLDLRALLFGIVKSDAFRLRKVVP